MEQVLTSSVERLELWVRRSQDRLARDRKYFGEIGYRQSLISRSATKLCRSRIMQPSLWLIVALAMVPIAAVSQSLSSTSDPSAYLPSATATNPELAYERPTEKTKVRNYTFNAYGPDPFVGAGLAAGINQLNNAPPEWHQGAEGFGRRFGSDFAIAAIGTSARYGLSEVFREDALYYRCECRGGLPRLSHAVLSTLIARRGMDGHRVFSFPALVAPYAGSFAAVYGWYPDRFGAKDAFRVGNYNLLAYMAGNISLELLYSSPRSLLSRMHLNNAHGAPVQGPNQ